jgi:acyl-coenzyme A synthetase/AMP-(fatty) acid ligase
VIGRSSEVTGEQDIVAFVQTALDSHVSSSELAKHAAQHLAPYKRPTEIHLISEMPLTISGKVIKDQLAQRLRDETTVR